MPRLAILFAQRAITFNNFGNSFGLAEALVLLVVLCSAWAIVTTWVDLSPKALRTANIVFGCIIAVVAIRFLFAFLF